MQSIHLGHGATPDITAAPRAGAARVRADLVASWHMPRGCSGSTPWPRAEMARIAPRAMGVRQRRADADGLRHLRSWCERFLGCCNTAGVGTLVLVSPGAPVPS